MLFEIELTESEINMALISMVNNKSPSNDSLAKSFRSFYCKDLKRIF